DARDAGRDEQIDAREHFLDLPAVLLALARGCCRLRVGHLETPLDLAADVLAVQLLVAEEQRAMDVGHLVHEIGTVRRGEWELDPPAVRKALRRRRNALTHVRLRLVEPRDADFEL